MSEVVVVPDDGQPTVVPMPSSAPVILSAPTVSAALDATGQPEGYVPTAQGDDTWTWAAQPATGMTGHGRPDHVGKWGILAPLGTVYTDLDGTDGAVQWIVDRYNKNAEWDSEVGGWVDTATWTVTAGGHWSEGELSLAGYAECSYSETDLPGSLSVQINLRPSGMGQGVEVVVPAVTIAPPNLPDFFGEPSVYFRGLLADNLVSRPVLNPGIDRELFLSEFTIGAFTEASPWTRGGIVITITGPSGRGWP